MIRLLGPCLETLLIKVHTCWTPWSVFRNGNEGRITRKKLMFGLSLSGSLGLVVRTWETQSSRSHFPHDEMDTVPDSQVRQRTAIASGALSDTEGGMMFNYCGCGQLHHTATENRADCDHGRHRPTTETSTPTKSLANS